MLSRMILEFSVKSGLIFSVEQSNLSTFAAHNGLQVESNFSVITFLLNIKEVGQLCKGCNITLTGCELHMCLVLSSLASHDGSVKHLLLGKSH